MRIIVSGKNIEITEALRDQVTKKVKKLERYFEPDTEAKVTMSVEKDRHIVEVTIPFDGVLLRGEEVTDDMYNSIEKVLDKLEKQIHRHRTKLEKKLKVDAFKYDTPVFGDQFGDKYKESHTKIVRTKKFAIKPMNEEEAALQMDLLGHTFFVFMNSDTDEVNVIYKRKDGNYGLIEPEYE